jgi:predicted SAM-dependent methyltransferase
MYPEDSLRNRRFFNIGAGGFSHEFWTNVDHGSDWYENKLKNNIHIDWNLLDLTPLPVENDVAEAVYTSHTIEHITDEAAANMFNEAYRILKPGGFLRVTTPDIDLDYRAYRDNDYNFF